MNDFLDRKDGESEIQYIYRICSNKELIGSWEEVADFLNGKLGLSYTECKYRKDFNTFKKIFEANKEIFCNQDNRIEELKEAERQLRKERYRLQTEKNEYNNWLRENARDELILEKMIDSISNINRIEIPEYKIDNVQYDKEYVLLFGDEHYGTEFTIRGIRNEVINHYSPEVFEDRMWNLLNKTLGIIEENSIRTLNVFSMGDFSDGVLRIGQLMKLRYGVVDSTVKYMEFMATWLNELSKHVYVKFYMVNGNHSEIRMFNQPRGTFKNENMGKIVSAYIKARLNENPNFEFVENGTDIIYANLAGYNIVGVHGENKDMEKELKDLSNIYNISIDYLIGGHLHHSESESVGINRGTIRVPSIVGVDEFSVKVRRIANPGATIVGFERNDGKFVEYNINL